MTLGCETPCKLLSAVLVGMAINDTPTLVTTDTCPAHLDPSLLQFQPCFGTLLGPPPALFASLMAFSREAVYLCDSPLGLAFCAGRRKGHNLEKKSQGQGRCLERF